MVPLAGGQATADRNSGHAGLPRSWSQNIALSSTLPGETKKTLCRISFLVTSRISLVTLISLPAVGGTRRKSRILKQREPRLHLRERGVWGLDGHLLEMDGHP